MACSFAHCGEHASSSRHTGTDFVHCIGTIWRPVPHFTVHLHQRHTANCPGGGGGGGSLNDQRIDIPTTKHAHLWLRTAIQIAGQLLCLGGVLYDLVDLQLHVFPLPVLLQHELLDLLRSALCLQQRESSCPCEWVRTQANMGLFFWAPKKNVLPQK